MDSRIEEQNIKRFACVYEGEGCIHPNGSLMIANTDLALLLELASTMPGCYVVPRHDDGSVDLNGYKDKNHPNWAPKWLVYVPTAFAETVIQNIAPYLRNRRREQIKRVYPHIEFPPIVSYGLEECAYLWEGEGSISSYINKGACRRALIHISLGMKDASDNAELVQEAAATLGLSVSRWKYKTRVHKLPRVGVRWRTESYDKVLSIVQSFLPFLSNERCIQMLDSFINYLDYQAELLQEVAAARI